ncbi:MAG TPA: ComEC/Rec2 family competence protein [Fluviicola sp.]|nr:ComEC/Rec2 family competence protein [Fluviicola sp.]
MLDVRKFPLLHAVFPFLIGLMAAYTFQWPVAIVLSVSLPLLAITLLTGLQPTRLSDNPAGRFVLMYTACFLLGILIFNVKDFRFQQDSIQRFGLKEIIVSGEVLEVKPGIGGKQQVLLRAEQVVEEDSVVACSGKIGIVVMDDRQLVHCGDEILVGGTLTKIENAGNPGEFDAVAFYESRKVSAMMFTPSEGIAKTGSRNSLNAILMNWREHLAKLMEQELDGTFLGIAKALMLGDKSDLDSETMNAFSTTGSMHVLAVSGLHIGLILMLLQRILQLFSRWITKRQAIIIAIVLIWIYGGITGASPAVMRAVVMFSILSGAQLLYRQTHPLNVLGFSAIVLLCFDPWMLFDLGFQLSYLAMLGIFLLYRPIVDSWVPTQKWVRLTWEGTAIGLAATVLTTPLILLWFYQFPNYFALANLGVMLFGFLVLMLGMVFLFTVWIPYLVKLVAVLFAFSIFGLVLWVKWVDSLPGAVSGGFHLTGWEVAVAYAIIIGWILHLQLKKGKRIWLIVPSLALIGWWMGQRYLVLQSEEWVVFNSNQFIAAVKSNNTLVGVYDCKWNGSWKTPRELEAYARFTGCEMKIYPLSHDKTAFNLKGTNWQFTKEKEGVAISANNKEWFYRTDGIPDVKEDRRLMTTRLQQFSDPDLPTRPFIRKL